VGKRITIKEIARIAEVSEAAVSIALNNKTGVSEETRDRIIGIARENGYNVNAARTKKGTNNIRFLACIGQGAVDQGFNYAPFFGAIIQKLTVECNKLGYNLIISSVNLNNIRRELEIIEKTLPSDGVILLGTNLNMKQTKQVATIQNKLVVIDNYFDTLPVDCVTMNNKMGGYQAADHLLKLGHQHICYAQSKSLSNNLLKRKEAFFEHLQENGVTVEKEYFVESTIELAVRDFLKILNDDGVTATAFACENDYLAIALIKVLSESGYIVPEDVSVIGFDDIANAAIVSPELTTIHVYTDEISELALQCLVAQMENQKRPSGNYFIDTSLIKRKSTRSAEKTC